MPGRIEISDADVVRMREDYDSGFYSTRELAPIYNTTQANVHAIVTGKSRKNCGGPTTAPEPKVYESLGAFLAGE
jgi:hypothetical protein